MKRLIYSTLYIPVFFFAVLLSCKKDLNETNSNPPGSSSRPIANAGPDKVVKLPTNTITLDGSGSKDEDGHIASYLWAKITGPETFTIVSPVASITQVKNLVQGSYQFELTVTDNSGLTGKDTVQVTVNTVGMPIPPIAKAGYDKVVVLPENSTNLDGSASNDPDGFITSYLWTKIAGPQSYLLQTPTSVITGLKNLVEGSYQFELTVTDNQGLTGKDTVAVSVAAAIPPRRTVNVTLTEIGTMTGGFRTVPVQVGSKAVFVSQSSATVTNLTIIDPQTGNIRAVFMPNSIWNFTVTSSGNKLYFGGGMRPINFESILVTYDLETNKWDSLPMPEARWMMGAGAVGNKVVFAGGISDEGWDESNQLDIFDIASKQWTRSFLSDSKYGMSAVTCGNKLYFGGGTEWLIANRKFDYAEYFDNNDGGIYKKPFNILSGKVSGLAVGNKIYWAGTDASGKVGSAEVWNTITGENSVYSLSYPRSFPTIVSKDQYILFGTPGDHWFFSVQEHHYDNRVDIYDTNTGEWLIGLLPQSFENAAYISVNNKIYLAGGALSNGSYNSKIYTLSW